MEKQSIPLRLQSAPLNGSFGQSWAIRLFGPKAINLFKEENGTAGFILWRKAIHSGYCKETDSGMNWGNLVDAWISMSKDGDPSTAVVGVWQGENQPLYGNYRSLFQEEKPEPQVGPKI